MKKVLLATTALMLSSGVALADGHITFSGSAAAGIASSGPGDDNSADGGIDHVAGETYAYSEVELDITFAGESDNGLSFGATVDINAGTGFDLGDDEFDVNDGAAGLGSIFISGDFGTLTFDKDGIDDLYDDDNSGDIMYEYSGSGLTFGIVYDVNNTDAASADLSVKIAYEFDSFSVTLTGNDGDDADSGSKIAFSYAASESLTLSASHDMPAIGDDVSEVGVDFTSGGVTVGATADTDRS